MGDQRDVTTPGPGAPRRLKTVVALDLESVLVPEFWVAIAASTGIAELSRTTRDERDYSALMDARLQLLASHSIDLDRVLQAIRALDPIDGARELLGELHRLGTDVVIVSDTFDVFAQQILDKLGGPAISCHTLRSEAGRITGYELRTPNHKVDVVNHMRTCGHVVVAVGDSYNDLAMIAAADHGILFRPPAAVRRTAPEVVAVDGHEDLLDAIRRVVHR